MGPGQHETSMRKRKGEGRRKRKAESKKGSISLGEVKPSRKRMKRSGPQGREKKKKGNGSRASPSVNWGTRGRVGSRNQRKKRGTRGETPYSPKTAAER